jgi:hypothetical protein
MKITGNQLRKIIAEEKQKLLSEMSPIMDAERTLGSSAPRPSIDAMGAAMGAFLQGTEIDLIEEDGLDEDEAEDKAAIALVLALAYELQSLGLVGPYLALYDLVQKDRVHQG